MDGWIDGQMDRLMDGRIDLSMDVQTDVDRWTGGWIDTCGRMNHCGWTKIDRLMDE